MIDSRFAFGLFLDHLESLILDSFLFFYYFSYSLPGVFVKVDIHA